MEIEGGTVIDAGEQPTARVIDYASSESRQEISDPSRPGLGSFVFGLIFFIPLINQIYAIGLGLLALRGPRGSTDRAFGIAGLVLGVLGVLFWGRAFLSVAGIWR